MIDRLFSFDIETAGSGLGYALQPWRADGTDAGEGWITTAAWVWVDDKPRAPKPEMPACDGLYFPDTDKLCELIETAHKTGRTLIGWNLTFDIAWLLAYARNYSTSASTYLRNTLLEIPLIDVMLVYKRFDNRHKLYLQEEKKMFGMDTSYSLKAAVSRYIPEHAGYEQDVNYHVDRGTPTTDPNFQRLMEYNKLDVMLTAKLLRKFWPELSAKQQRMAIAESAAIPHIAEAWLNGINIDKPATKAMTLAAVQSRGMCEGALGVSGDVLGSPKQLGDLLFNQWGLTPLKHGKAGPSTDKTSLTYLSDTDIRCDTILKWRKCNTRVNKFGKATAESVQYNGDDKVHPSPKIAGTYTGRMTYSSATLSFEINKQGKEVKRFLPTGVAIHQWESDPAVRAMLVPPGGYVLAELDFSGQELRLMADISRDNSMMKVFQEGLDGHSLMACDIYGHDYEEFERRREQGDELIEKQRKIGKLANFSLQYRTGYRKFRDIVRVQGGVSITETEAMKVRDAFRNKRSGVKAYWDNQIYRGRHAGYVMTAGGSRLDLKGWGTDEDWKLEQSAINFPIQGTGADQKTLALEALKPLMIQHAVQFAWDLHDGLFFYVPAWADSEAIVLAMKKTMETIDYRTIWGWDHALTYPVDAMIGPSWAELKGVG